MNRHRMFSSQMGSSKYEFCGNLDADIEKKQNAAEKRKKEIREKIFKIYQSYGREHAEKELIDLVIGLIGKEIVITPDGFKEIKKVGLNEKN
ncbi:hypothetical protein [Enterococcus avium]|uniref:hypothetical protein n=1 Tax=Enterococcus avium TaxID=33945 RepID=UPI0022E034E7|nr:hypothetical protein [Enterococcus avium]